MDALSNRKSFARRAILIVLNYIRRDSGQKAGFPDQQLQITCPDHHGDLSQALADRIIFQVDQATSANQSVLRHIRECGQITNMDCDLRLCFDSDYQEGVESGTMFLNDFTDHQRDAFRKNTAFTGAYGCRNDERKH